MLNSSWRINLKDITLTNLINSKDLSKEILEAIFERASFFKKNYKGKNFPFLEGKNLALALFEPSTRTKFSFELAAKRLSAEVINFDVSSSSTSKGETVVDTLWTLEAMGIDIFIVRHQQAGIFDQIQTHVVKNLVNAGDGERDHPTQGLLDSFTLIERFGDISGLNLTIVGDIKNSRVARSNYHILKEQGVNISICAPDSLSPKDDFSDIPKHDNIDSAIEQSDVLMMLRIQKERMGTKELSIEGDYNSNYSLTIDKFNKKKDLVVLHPGPVNYGIEMEKSVAFHDNCLLQKQVENGVFIRMAVLSLLAGE